MNLDIYIFGGVATIFLLLVIWIIRLEIKLKKLLAGKSKTLDESIENLKIDTGFLKNKAEKTENDLSIINKKLKKTISGNETVRFNPFKGTGSGSNQSFATALINAEGNGVVISSLYSRDHVSIFSKPIKNLASEYELSVEEKLALQKAQESIV